METNDFLQGQEDCREGKSHEAGKSDSYDRGYSTQYEWEQILGAMYER